MYKKYLFLIIAFFCISNDVYAMSTSIRAFANKLFFSFKWYCTKFKQIPPFTKQLVNTYATCPTVLRNIQKNEFTADQWSDFCNSLIRPAANLTYVNGKPVILPETKRLIEELDPWSLYGFEKNWSMPEGMLSSEVSMLKKCLEDEKIEIVRNRECNKVDVTRPFVISIEGDGHKYVKLMSNQHVRSIEIKASLLSDQFLKTDISCYNHQAQIILGIPNYRNCSQIALDIAKALAEFLKDESSQEFKQLFLNIQCDDDFKVAVDLLCSELVRFLPQFYDQISLKAKEPGKIGLYCLQKRWDLAMKYFKQKINNDLFNMQNERVQSSQSPWQKSEE